MGRYPDSGGFARRRRDPCILHDTPKIEHAVTTFARIANGGLIVTAGRVRRFIVI